VLKHPAKAHVASMRRRSSEKTRKPARCGIGVARYAADGRTSFRTLRPNYRLGLIAVPLMTPTDFAGPPICEGPVPRCAKPVPLIALPRATGTVMLVVALACVIRLVPTPTAFGVAIGATARAAGGA